MPFLPPLWGLDSSFSTPTHGLRRGLYSSAASRLRPCGTKPYGVVENSCDFRARKRDSGSASLSCTLDLTRGLARLHVDATQDAISFAPSGLVSSFSTPTHGLRPSTSLRTGCSLALLRS